MSRMRSDWTYASLIVSVVVLSSGLAVGLAIKSAPRPAPSLDAGKPERTTSVARSLSPDPADQSEPTMLAPANRPSTPPINLGCAYINMPTEGAVPSEGCGAPSTPDPLVTSALPSPSSEGTKRAEAAAKKGASSASPRDAHASLKLSTARPDRRNHPFPPIRPASKLEQAVDGSKGSARGLSTRKGV
jgi:hypothetical protein